MEQVILDALNEMTGENFQRLVEAREYYSDKEILDFWLSYEGILGYTSKIVEVTKTLDKL